LPGRAAPDRFQGVVHRACAAGRRKPSRLVDACPLPGPDHADRRVRCFPRHHRAYAAGI